MISTYDGSEALAKPEKAMQARFDRVGIAVRAGDLASLPALRRFGVRAAVRASCYIYTSTEDIDRLIAEREKYAGSGNR